jgi:hypothetical protein
VLLSAESFGDVTVPATTEKITVQGQVGTRLRRLIARAPGVVYDGLDIDAGGAKTAGAVVEFEAAGATLRDSKVGNVRDEKGVLSHSTCVGCVYDNVLFHDVLVKTSGVHNECMYSQSPGIVIRNSRFTNCATMDVFFTRGSWWGQPLYGGFELVGNFFGKTFKVDGSVHYFSLGWHDVMEGIRNLTARGNTFELPVNPGSNTATNSAESCNTPQLDIPGITHEACAPEPDPEPTPEPEPAYAPACAPTCDEQIAELTADRDEWKRKAGVWLDKLVRISAILDE